MHDLNLRDFELHSVVGTGADYEVRLAGPIGEPPNLVLKRPNPHAILKNLHRSTEHRTQKMLKFHEEIGNNIDGITTIVGYFNNTPESTQLYSDDLGHDYTVVCQARAPGIPLNADVRARILKVPTGLGQNLFSIFPLGIVNKFAIALKIMEIQNNLYEQGYLLFDLNPQNIFYSPNTSEINVIDTADLHNLSGDNDVKTSNKCKEDFFLELIRYFIAAEDIPIEESGYYLPRGDRPYTDQKSELTSLKLQFEQMNSLDAPIMINILSKIQSNQYGNVFEFNQDMMEYFAMAERRIELAKENPQILESWHSARKLLHHDHWSKYDFDPDHDL